MSRWWAKPLSDWPDDEILAPMSSHEPYPHDSDLPRAESAVPVKNPDDLPDEYDLIFHFVSGRSLIVQNAQNVRPFNGRSTKGFLLQDCRAAPWLHINGEQTGSGVDIQISHVTHIEVRSIQDRIDEDKRMEKFQRRLTDL